VLGADVSGVVEEADPSSGFAKGERVMGCTGQVRKGLGWDGMG
jgi:NADPH:quinone reductase-like Zn-dependent oxidoreductase